MDLNDVGTPTPGLSVNFNLPGFGTYSASSFYTCPGFTGFGNPSIQNDLGLIHLANPLPNNVLFPALSGQLQTGSQVTLAGFGRSGYGDYGYTTPASLTDRRSGQNVIDTLTPDENGGGFAALFQYTFDAPNTGNSLGNNIETIIGPGDSGGPALVPDGTGYAIAGVNTFVEGYGGQFGDIGGGIVLAPYVSWIDSITGIDSVPEPSVFALAALGLIILLILRRILKLPINPELWYCRTPVAPRVFSLSAIGKWGRGAG